jgi:hypothetical protein
MYDDEDSMCKLTPIDRDLILLSKMDIDTYKIIKNYKRCKSI